MFGVLLPCIFRKINRQLQVLSLSVLTHTRKTSRLYPIMDMCPWVPSLENPVMLLCKLCFKNFPTCQSTKFNICLSVMLYQADQSLLKSLTNLLFEQSEMDLSNYIKLLLLLTINLYEPVSSASILEWIGLGSTKPVEETAVADGVPLMKVPYEEASPEEKFLQEAEKFIALHKSELDSCQHRVVMKIRSSCGSISDEELAKLSVNLLNCQSAVEGRQQFPCTDNMSLRQCTSSMDSDMWNTYHLMNNRARAVCYSARHQQFRALSEMTVNKLMSSAHEQLKAMDALQVGQEKLESITSDTLQSISTGHKSLMAEQEKLHSTQQSVHSFVSMNLRQLTREKALIAAGQKELALMTKEVKMKLDAASTQLSEQSKERQNNHQKIMEDLENLQAKAMEIWERIDTSTQQIMAQHEVAAANLNQTLNNLAKINSTVEFLLTLVEKTRVKIDERLGWIISFIGDTGEQLEWLQLCLQHCLFLVLGMVTLSFINAPPATRLALLFVVPTNLFVSSQQGRDKALDLPGVAIVLSGFAVFHWMLMQAYELVRPSGSLEYSPQHIMWMANNRAPGPRPNGVATSSASSQQTSTSPTILSQYAVAAKAKALFWYNISKDFVVDMFGPSNVRGEEQRNESFPRRESEEADGPSWNGLDRSRDSDDEGSIIQELRQRVNSASSSQYSRSLLENKKLFTPTRSSSPGASSTHSASSFRSNSSRMQCSGVTKAGLPCRNFAVAASDFCRAHSVTSPARNLNSLLE